MVIGYMVFPAIWSIFGWSRFPYTKNYRIYGQIPDIWSIYGELYGVKLMKSMPITDCLAPFLRKPGFLKNPGRYHQMVFVSA